MRDAKNLELTMGERSRMREELLSFVRNGDMPRFHPQRSKGSYVSFNYLKPMPLLLALVILLGGGTSFAAEKALPGDFLFPVKVHVNEEVKSMLSVSDSAKADWETSRADRRLSETEQLASEHQIDPKALAQIESNFQAQADRINELIAQLQEKNKTADASAIAARFQGVLETHKTILAALAKSDAEDKDELKTVENNVQTELDDVNKTEQDIEDGISHDTAPVPQQAAEGKMQAAQNVIDEVTKNIAKTKDRLGAAATAQAEAKLADANIKFAQAKAKFDAKAYADAFGGFQDTIQLAHEAQTLLHLREDHQIELKSDGSVEINAGEDDHEDVRASVSASPRLEIEHESNNSESSGERD